MGAERASRISRAVHTASLARPDEHPEGPPEVAFCGRSNVGKSSLLNVLAGRRGLARISKTPGRTQRVHVYDIEFAGHRALRFVDLPGYGHARVPQAVRALFGPMIESWLLGRSTLAMVLVLIDARRKPSQEEVGLLSWLRAKGLPARVVFTKIDKIPKNRRFGELARLAKGYGERETPLATSASSGEGIDALRAWIATMAAPPTR